MDGHGLPPFPKAERRISAKGDSAPLLHLSLPEESNSSAKPFASPPPASPVGTAGSDAEAVFNMVNAVLGAGVLGYPFCFRSCGVGLATLLVLACWGASHFSMRLLLLTAQLVGARSYEDLTRSLLGRTGQQTLITCVITLNLGALIAYVNILADVLSSVAGSIIPPGAEPSRNALLTGITLFGVWPVALVVRSPEVLAKVSQASVAVVIVFAAMVVYFALGPPLLKQPAVDIELWRWDGVLVAFPVIAYGYTAQQFLFGIYASLKAPSVRRMTGIVYKALVLCTLVYLVVGVGGYAAFRQRTSGDVLRNFGGASVARVVKVAYGLALLGTVPLLVMPLHDSMLPLVSCLGSIDSPNGSPPTPLQQQAITSLVLGAALAAAVLIPNVEFVFGLVGSTAAALLSFIFPAWVFLLAATPERTCARADLALPQWQWGGMRHRAWLLLVLGMVVGVACTHATLMAVHEENQVVALAQDLAASNVQVEEATRKHAVAVQVAENVRTVSSAAAQVGGAQLHANATRTSAAQAQAALESLDTSRGGSAADQARAQAGEQPGGTAGKGGRVQGQAAAQQRDKPQSAGASGSQQAGLAGSGASHAAHEESFALGAVMANLRDMKVRINSTMHTFEAVTAALNATSIRMRQEQKRLEAAHRRAQNETKRIGEFGDQDSPGKEADGTAAAPAVALLSATQKERDVAAREFGALVRVERMADETLKAIRATAGALAEAEKAVDVVERAKGKPEDPATRAAVQVMLAAVASTEETSKQVDATLHELQLLQERHAEQLSQLQRSQVDGASGGREQLRRALPKDAAAGNAVLEDIAGDVSKARPGLLGSANVTQAAQAAVAAASSELGAALASANLTLERTQREDPEVVSRAEKIAEELGRVARETVEEETELESMQHGDQDTDPENNAAGAPIEVIEANSNATLFLNV